jgi:ABC-2 type transport system permease protein
MSAALAISKREVRSYFNSPVAYIVVSVFVVVSGFMFFSRLFLERNAELRSYVSFAPFLFMLMLPAVTMRLLAEEKGSGTLELLITMPVRDWEVVVGKYLAALALLATIVLLTTSYAFSVGAIGSLDKGPAAVAYLGIFLSGAAYMAIGVMASSLTRSQIVAFIIALGLSFPLLLFGWISQIVPPGLQPVVSFLAMETHMESISRGVIDTRDLVYFGSIIAVSLVIATVSLESRKWK